jgi:VIT1/CCC1 family predicted Fe2+/Mn2+ transporter
MIDEDKLNYIGSVVLGLNDALVELTGALAGFTLALSNSRLIAIVGLITGIAASLSMASSEYLSTKTDADHAEALKSSFYTGIAYIFTVIFLVTPFFIIESIYAIFISIFIGLLIIFVFNYYVSVVKDLNFKKRFFEMAGLSLGVALLSFLVGFVVKIVFGIDGI